MSQEIKKNKKHYYYIPAVTLLASTMLIFSEVDGSIEKMDIFSASNSINDENPKNTLQSGADFSSFTIKAQSTEIGAGEKTSVSLQATLSNYFDEEIVLFVDNKEEIRVGGERLQSNIDLASGQHIIKVCIDNKRKCREEQINIKENIVDKPILKTIDNIMIECSQSERRIGAC